MRIPHPHGLCVVPHWPTLAEGHLDRGRSLALEAMLLPPLTCSNDYPEHSKKICPDRGGPQKPMQFVEQSEHGQEIGKIAAGQVLMDAGEGAMQLLATQQVRQIYRDRDENPPKS